MTTTKARPRGASMSDTPNLESFEKGGSNTGKKILGIDFKAEPPKVDDGILSPYRDEVLDS